MLRWLTLSVLVTVSACGGTQADYGERACHIRSTICAACKTACDATAGHCTARPDGGP